MPRRQNPNKMIPMGFALTPVMLDRLNLEAKRKGLSTINELIRNIILEHFRLEDDAARKERMELMKMSSAASAAAAATKKKDVKKQ